MKLARLKPKPGLMTNGDLETVLGWAEDLGWNPGHEDAAVFCATDPSGFFVSRVGGTPVAAISVVNHSDAFAFLGLYICVPEWRGRGVGLDLWQIALMHADQRTIGLDGVPEQQQNYEASGFVGSGRTTRYIGSIGGDAGQVAKADPSMVDALASLEAKATGYRKRVFMRHWLTPCATRKTLALQDAQGFVTVRKCKMGAKIGPLVAQCLEDAKSLLHAAASVFGGPVTIDVPDDAGGLAAYCTYLGMTSDFSTTRMYRGRAPRPGGLIHAVATLELG